MQTKPASLEDRQQAIRSYIESSDDREAARAFMADCLDPVQDVELLTWLDENFPDPTSV